MPASKAKKPPKAAAGPSSPGRMATLPAPLGKGPRFDQYGKLMHRFFEPLILLHTLGKTRGVHSPASVEEGSIEFTRKTFLDDLSYICDFEKGGQTTAAVAVEADSNRYIFWFALNKSSPKITTFLESTLDIISGSIRATNAQGQGVVRNEFVAKLTRHCFEHARTRVKEEVRLLRGYIKGCRSFLAQESDAELANWLSRFQEGDDSEVCSLAFEHRQSEKMADIRNRGRQSRFSSGAVLDMKFNNPFAAVHHFIGRIAHHVRAPKRLVESAQCFEQVLDSNYVVCRVPILKRVPAPQPDDMTNLPSILNRMGVKDEETIEALMELDRMHGIQERVLMQYQNSNFEPTVHAEIHIHEHFFNAPGGQKNFAFDLPVIGCSKPACYCCKLYIKHHPARCVEPESHENVWLKWSPPALPRGHLDAGFVGQRAVLQKMIEEIRRSAVEQIQARRGPGNSHPDSTTGITKLTRANLARARGVGPSLAALSIQESPVEYQHWDGGSEYGEDGDTVHNPSRPGSSAGSGSSEIPSRSSLDFSPSPASHSPSAEVEESDADSDDDDGGGVLLFKPRQQNWPRV
ncbi:hypothetical protein MAPG_00280 [Magnaporthiopsis poae ATCC 64411]|uniref:Uncharacterized protein n=1 Tax=Magnaporthiopsis poae (strain ATCC 64411 / 73-15) TaxID=644358 RepID=A0A0C4DKK5_MAGP6|nr:hypothetical protein MAPG_00280 [Magnaporthiopsis poae ATCC 64411]